MKKNILVVYGGKSCEHDISVITALQAMRSVGDRHNLIPLYIRDGVFTGECLKDIDFYKNFDLNGYIPKKAEFTDGGIRAYKCRLFKKRIDIDCALLCCHGGLGENGGLQGLLEFYNIPYTSPGIAASAVFMDKVLTKQFAAAEKYPILPYFVITDTEIDALKLPKDMAYPLIVKPASLGSSIGISVAHNRDELKKACVVAAEFDSKIVVEQALVDFCEINCAAIRDGNEIIISECEKPVSWSEFLSFDEKYL
ncbi:MAG: D-alanine--D-alanine ligase, partial [Clostridiales bacterium]|nr:D-alanine--D-alanine ligase [Clostridiales bacterium]